MSMTITIIVKDNFIVTTFIEKKDSTFTLGIYILLCKCD